MKKKEEIIAENTSVPETKQNETVATNEPLTLDVAKSKDTGFVIFEKAKKELSENEEAVSGKNVKIFTFDTIRTAIILLLVTGFTVLLLAFINYFTAAPIAAAKKAELDNAVEAMFPESEYTQIPDVEFSKEIDTVYLIHKGDEPCGFLVIAKPTGFGGEMEIMVGTDLEGVVSGVKIISDSETATKVAPLKAEGFLDNQYVSKKAPFSFTKDGGTVEIVAGSTVSSDAVIFGVNSACEAVDTYLDSLRKE